MMGLATGAGRAEDRAAPGAAALDGCTDDRLLALYEGERSAAAFAALVARHGPMVYRTCRRLLPGAHDAEDATQATFLLLARRPDRARGSPAGWLYTVARRAALQVLQDRARRRRREEAAAQMETTPAADDGRLREEIDAALANLPRHLQEAVVLCHLEGRSQQEAAALLGCHQGTLSRRVRDGLDRLRRLLLGRGVGVSAATLTAFLATEAAATAAAPAAVLTAATATATAGAAVGGNAALLADGVAKAVAWAKAKMIAAVTAAAVVPVAVTVPLVLPDKPAEAPAAEGHRYWEPAVAFTPDGKTVAAAARDGSVRLWDVATGTERAVLPGHPAGVTSVAVAADGRTLASGDFGGNVFLWDVTTEKRKAELPTLPAGVTSVAFLPDGRLAVGTRDGAVRVRDLNSGAERLLHPAGNSNLANKVDVAPGGRWVASTVSGGLLTQVWDPATGKEKNTLRGGMEDVTQVAFLADGKELAAAGRLHGGGPGRAEPGAFVRVYDVISGKERQLIRGGRGALLQSLAASPAGPVIAWAEQLPTADPAAPEVTVKIWDVDRRKAVATFPAPSRYVRPAFSPDGKTLALGCFDGTVRFRPVPPRAP